MLRRIALLVSAVAAVVPFGGPAGAWLGARQDATVLMSTNDEARAFQEEYGFSDAIIVGDMIYLSGIVVGQASGEPLEASYDRTYRQIGAILKRAGASWDDVVDMTSYHTDLGAQLPEMKAAQKKHVKAPFPAWTAIQVVRLVPDGGLTEIKITAKKTRSGARSG